MDGTIVPEGAQRVLVYRLGSIGDTVVALPCLHLVRRRFPAAEIALLTNRPVESRAAPMASVLDGTGLVDRYIGYPIRTRRITDLMRLRRAIGGFAPDLLVYLVSRPTAALVRRDHLFFRLAGIRQSVGFPFAREQRISRSPTAPNGVWEPEASRLARCVAPLGSAEIDRLASWNLHLTVSEREEAARLLATRMPYGQAVPSRLLGLSIGTKQLTKDWGDRNWRAALAALADPAFGLVLIGAGDERERSQEIARDWPGRVINLCGRASPRVSAAVIERLMFLLCPDSGPMHLAAAVGTRCVAVFSRHNLPGQWFPFGVGHKVLYPEGGPPQPVEPRRVVEAAHALLADVRERVEARA
ncbi:MAG TPA: glycosyltransferase family 9 protein [Candidatus Binataceae bacterium]|nr:glycosyltransferase family 9 protein [Candidatus Binataceae bacterium]